MLPLLDELWRADHPRTGAVLEAVGRHHPDKVVAKDARKSLQKLRGRQECRTPGA